jgi:regulator of nucleoside diphosphate kinase
MLERFELFVSARDAEALAAMLAEHRRANAFEADASDELADLLMEARLVPAEKLPDGYVGLRTTVSYEEPSGLNRTVTLVLPQAANAAQGKISVLSPIGLALLGRRRGAVVNAATPNGKALTIRIVDATRADHPIAEAA